MPGRLAAIALPLLLAACAPGYVPHAGQAGKDAVWVPTPQALVDKMLDMAQLTPQDFLMDLGSGDGRLVITAARRGATAQGIEYNPDLVALSQRAARDEGVAAKATFVKADIFQTDFSRATVITLFMLPSINLKLQPRLLALKPGTRIVANTFTIGDWVPDRTETLPYDSHCSSGFCTAHLWIVPARFAGRHTIPQGELVLAQRNQKLSGTLRGMGEIQEVSGKVRGEEAFFNAGGRAYRARLNGSVLELLP